MSRTATFGERKAQTSQEVWPDRFESDPRWLLALRVAGSHAFARSRFLSRFLLYIVAETLEGRTEEISEHQIGVQVFDRRQDYRPAEDNIVRSYARQLRGRLAEYFSGEGASETLHIDIPLGAYVPVFQPAFGEKPDMQRVSVAGPVAIASPTPLLDIPALATRRQGIWKIRILLIASLAVYSIALVWFANVFENRLQSRAVASPVGDSTAALWTTLFGGPANCYIVPADAGFNLIEDLSHRSLALAAYLNRSYLNIPLTEMDEHSAEDLRGQHFTSFVDLETVTALARLPEFNPHRAILRFPRDLQLDDLKSSNVIILGSMSSNPWAAIAENNANFRIVNGTTMREAKVINLRPQPGEAPSYASHWNEPAHETYAVIAFLPNLSGNGHLLLIQGLDVAGTEAAAEMLLHPAAISGLMQRATRSDGSLRSFEVLLRSTSIESRSTSTEIVGTRVY